MTVETLTCHDAIEFLDQVVVALGTEDPGSGLFSWPREAARLRGRVRRNSLDQLKLGISAREYLLLADQLERGDRKALAASLRRLYTSLQPKVFELADRIEHEGAA